MLRLSPSDLCHDMPPGFMVTLCTAGCLTAPRILPTRTVQCNDRSVSPDIDQTALAGALLCQRQHISWHDRGKRILSPGLWSSCLTGDPMHITLASFPPREIPRGNMGDGCFSSASEFPIPISSTSAEMKDKSILQ